MKIFAIIPTIEKNNSIPQIYDYLKSSPLIYDVYLSYDTSNNASHTRNEGIKHILSKHKNIITDDDFILLCDDDIIPISNDNLNHILKTMISYSDKYHNYAISPCIMNQDLINIFSTDVFYVPTRCFNHKNHKYVENYHSYFKSNCEALSSGFLLVKITAFTKHNIFFDENFQNSQFEDVDFTMSLRKAGFNLLYNGSLLIIHNHKRAITREKLNIAQKNHKYLLDKWVMYS